jgi:hypothetical protein
MRRTLRAVLLIGYDGTMRKTALIAAALVFVVSGVTRAEDPECITSDTLDYCAKLARKMDALSNMPPHAHALWLQGQAMYEHGQIRAGLARLRRAMIIVRNGDGP